MDGWMNYTMFPLDFKHFSCENLHVVSQSPLMPPKMGSLSVRRWLRPLVPGSSSDWLSRQPCVKKINKQTKTFTYYNSHILHHNWLLANHMITISLTSSTWLSRSWFSWDAAWLSCLWRLSSAAISWDRTSSSELWALNDMSVVTTIATLYQRNNVIKSNSM